MALEQGRSVERRVGGSAWLGKCVRKRLLRMHQFRYGHDCAELLLSNSKSQLADAKRLNGCKSTTP